MVACHISLLNWRESVARQMRFQRKNKTELSCPVLVTPRFARVGLRTKISRHHAESLFGGASRSTNHRYGLTSDHDSSMRTSRRRRAGAKVENIFPFSKARFLRRLLHKPSGCESAQSVLRSSFRRPGLLPGYSRCERFPDKLCSCAASRTVVRTTCALPPLWQLLSPSGDNGAGTACETLRPNA